MNNSQKGIATLKDILIIVVAAVLIGGGVFAYKYWWMPKEEATMQDETADWETYTNTKYGFEIKYPLGLKIDNAIRIITIEEIREQYEKAEKEGGCPGKCSILAANKDILEEQFEILTKATKECHYSEDFNENIKENFILFQSALGGIHGVEGIYNDNLKKCFMRLIGYDGYDAGIYNFYYRAGLLSDGKVIEIYLDIFQFGIFEEVDQLLRDLGFSGDSCDANCYEKQVDYYTNTKNINDDSEDMYYDNIIIENVVKKYDKMLSTFKFLK